MYINLLTCAISMNLSIHRPLCLDDGKDTIMDVMMAPTAFVR